MGGESSKQRHLRSSANSKKCMTSPNKHKMMPPSIRIGNSLSCNESLLTVDLEQCQRSMSALEYNVDRSRSGSICSARSTSTRHKHPISIRDRQLIQTCFQNPHEIIGRKILKRACEKRTDFAQFCSRMENEQEEIEENIKLLLKKAVANINFIDEVQRLAEEFGSKHVKYRPIGFKPDFFGAYADATITECTFLDGAVHPAHQTLSAFSSFITMVYSSVRDGFYAEMRRMRRTSNSFSTGSNSSYWRKVHSNECASDNSPRSLSPDADSRDSDELSGVVMLADSDSFLKPPIR